MGSYERVNTISLNLVNIKEKLTVYETHLLIKNSLQLEASEVIAIEIYQAKVFIKVDTEKTLEKIFEQYENKLFYTDKNGEKFEIILTNETRRTTVKVHNLPIEIPDDEVVKSLESYGNVEDCIHEKWKNVPYPCYNGTRALKMLIKNPIPSYVNIGNKRFWTTHFGQQRTCRRCSSTSHEAKDCSYTAENIIRRKLNYAYVTAGQLNENNAMEFIANSNILEENNASNDNTAAYELSKTVNSQTEENPVDLSGVCCNQEQERNRRMQKRKQLKAQSPTESGNSTDEKPSKPKKVQFAWSEDVEDFYNENPKNAELTNPRSFQEKQDDSFHLPSVESAISGLLSSDNESDNNVEDPSKQQNSTSLL